VPGLFRRPARGALGLLFGLDAIPVTLHMGSRYSPVLVGEHMRMPSDHFSRHRLDDVAERKGAVLLRHPRVEHDLQQQIAEFVAEIVEIAAGDGVDDLIGLLDGILRDRRKILFEVPGAAGHRRAQRRHDLEQT
jgi:hypothetical protein